MSTQHTPGPWVHATDMGQVGSVEFADGTVIAQAQQLPGDLRSEQRNANARLIAAAPDGLDAAQEALIALEGAPHSMAVQIARQKLRAFIAKATGGAA